jgi:protein TonB
MLAYAAHRRAHRRVHPATLALIIGAHAVALGLLVTAKMEVGVFKPDPPLVIKPIPLPKDPPPLPPEPAAKPLPAPPMSSIDIPPKTVTLPLDTGPVVIPGPTPDIINPVVGTNPLPMPITIPVPLPQPLPKITSKPALLTSGDRLRPPYPESKRRLEQEATLRLRLSIDERGRVTAVEPIGATDPEFLAAARNHLIRYWRYKPAVAEGQAVPASLTINLSFRLEED